MSTLSIGIIGGGYWGEKLFRVFGGLRGVRVRALCDADPQRGAIVEGDIRFVSSATDLLRSADIDTVLVATPPSTHFALAREVLAAGKHCWVEKPLAMRAIEAQELVAAARQRGVTLFVDETFLYDPLLQQAKRWIDAGRLGHVYHLSFERLGMGRIRRDSNVWWNSAPHDLSILRYLVAADVDGVHMDAFSYLQSGIADMTVTTVRLAGGVSAHIYLSWLSPLKVASIVVVGSKGMFHYEGRFGKRALQYFDYAVADPASVRDNVVPIPTFAATETVAGGAEEPLALAAEAFVTSIRSGIPAPSAGEYSQKVVELLEAADRSAAIRW
ncbi:MAG: Gfo/Idh/MocA family oxidoreductase [Candidatus Binatia bacterium]